jgi:Na+/H+ antiporter NhaD/arsenite permease-like protein
VTLTTATIFLAAYAGMILGGLPFFQLDRTGVALLGAIALITVDAVGLREEAESIHLPTLILLFSFMVIAAQMRLGGFYDWVARWLGALSLAPPLLLGAVIFVIAVLSAVFSNDIVCLAITPVLIDACRRRRIDPIPFLLGLACAANIGSAATLIGNPQNMLIGQTLRLSFAGYFAQAALPVGLGLLLTWAWLVWQSAGRWNPAQIDDTMNRTHSPVREGLPLNVWQTAKGLAVAGALLVAFLVGRWPREHVALAGAGLLLMSRKLHSRQVLGLVDWELLVLFAGLFVVSHTLQQTGFTADMLVRLAGSGLNLAHPAWLSAVTVFLSNLVSNVPAVMLLLPMAHERNMGPLLALVSTFSGNLLVVGSIANLIVLDAAARQGIRIGWWQHARTGMPLALLTSAIAVAYVYLR